MYSLIVFLPFFSSVLTGFFGYRLGIKGTALVTNVSLFLAVCLSYFCLIDLGFLLKPIYIDLFY
jgi:NADH:ubiquinone oxidoreductase subunit 5 (subunit L)/multisubunit Na+/H+ antiporter MnhA subunit